MANLKLTALAAIVFVGVTTSAAAPPAAPLDPAHPGSQVYDRAFVQKTISCFGRQVDVYLPQASAGGAGTFAVVVYGHGQALGRSSYAATFEHLAKKGTAVVFPTYDTGFFDQDWQRMGSDYVKLSDCALAKFPELDSARVIYSGHSKGAYVASIALGLAESLHAAGRPKAAVLFEPAGMDSASLKLTNAQSALTVVFGESDTTVDRSISERLYAEAPCTKKQFILVRDYVTTPALKADHMWPLTEATFFGGHEVSALHYYGSWKWLTAAADDLTQGSGFTNDYLYGNQAGDKGVTGQADEIRRSW